MDLSYASICRVKYISFKPLHENKYTGLKFGKPAGEDICLSTLFPLVVRMWNVTQSRHLWLY